MEEECRKILACPWNAYIIEEIMFFILSFLMGIENDSGYAFMRLRVSGWAGNKRIAHE